MSRPNYGPADHCQFNDYPKEIRLVVGQLLAENSDLFDYGQTVVLQQTSNSGVLQGDKVVGEELPKKAMIYTDTGDDESFNLKIEYYGWGEFFVATEEGTDGTGDEDYHTLDIKKGMSVQAADWDNPQIFENVYRGPTEIPASKDLNTDVGTTVKISKVDLEVELSPDETYEPSSDSDDSGGSGPVEDDSSGYDDEDCSQPGVKCYDSMNPIDSERIALTNS